MQTPAVQQRCMRHNYGGLVAYTYPRAGHEGLVLCQKWLTIGFLFDDLFSEGKRSYEQLFSTISVIKETLLAEDSVTPRPAAPALRALTELRSESLKSRSRAWSDRFVQNIVDFYEGFLGEFMNQVSGKPVSINDYTELRRKSVGIPHAFDLMELTESIELAQPLYDSRIWTELRDAAIDVIAYSNDILSLEKELIHGEVNNLVLVIENSHGVNRNEAIAYARSLLESRVSDYLRAEQSLPMVFDDLGLGDSSRTDAQRCARGYRDWMAGYIHWHLSETTRYEEAVTSSSGQEISQMESMLKEL